MDYEYLATRKRRVFESVFGTSKLSQPTPFATPVAPGHVWSSSGAALPVAASLAHDAQDAGHVEQQVRWDRAWHVVTEYLLLKKVPFAADISDLLESELRAPSAKVVEAIKDVLNPRQRVPLASHTEDIVEWHTQQSREHFLQQVLPLLHGTLQERNAEKIIVGCLRLVHGVQKQYLGGLAVLAEQQDKMAPGSAQKMYQKFTRSLDAVIGHAMERRLRPAMREVLGGYIRKVLGLPGLGDEEQDVIAPAAADADRTCRQMLRLVESLRKVGLSGEEFQVIFAELMNDAMNQYIYCAFQKDWQYLDGDDGNVTRTVNSILPKSAHQAFPSRNIVDLCEWVEERYSKLIVLVFKVLDNVEITSTDNDRWKEIGIGRLAMLRTSELYDIVARWPSSDKALHDLRTSITTPQRRLHLTKLYARMLHDRLLQPGAATISILRAYISMIWSFNALDHSMVLLERVAYPLQMYLCSRDDTVRIVLTGLLAETYDKDRQRLPVGVGDKLHELATMLHASTDWLQKGVVDEGMDWHDMEWMPDPVDAGPGYRRPKRVDVIGTLISVLGTQEVFIKEFQDILAQRLLRQGENWDRELKVLELLSHRFGAQSLQSCEVMLKDVLDSSKLDKIIRRRRRLDGDAPRPQLHAKILSRLYWPTLQEEEYKVPGVITDLQEQYDEGFHEIKTSRLLKWQHALGSVTVELELADRRLVEEVHTWQATVIYAFHDPDNDASIARSFSELEAMLEMDPHLLRSALTFWLNKAVLREGPRDTFTVLETLAAGESPSAHGSASALPPRGAADDDAAQHGISDDKMAMYWQFIRGMLTNSQKEMGLAQIGMMLRMLIADGFPHGDDELAELLTTKVHHGEMEVKAGKYRLKK